MKIPKKYQKDIDIAVNILKEEGCSEIYIFGSIVRGNSNPKSDIDFVVKGIQKGHFFEVYSKLYMALEHSIDLIDMNINKDFVKHIFKTGNIVRVA